VQRVARVLREDTVLEVRVAAASTLGKLGTRSALEPLTRALTAARPVPLRAAAARALGDLGTPSAVGELVALLDDDAYRVAHEAAHALRRLGPKGLAALQAVVDEDRRLARESGAGAHAKPSPAAAHAREALALAAVTVETDEQVAA
jgi:HEAT repeat protein